MRVHRTRLASSATWKDITQLAWAIALVVPFIAIGAFCLRGLVGTRAAAWVGVGLATFVAVVFVLIVCLNLIGSFGIEFMQRIRRQRGSGEI